jgi:RHS repeat-associated protein
VYRLASETISALQGGSFTCGANNQKCGAVGYTYDSVGNRKQMDSTLGVIPAGLWNYDANDRLSTDTYDDAGNTVWSAGIENKYDFENHLIQHGEIKVIYDGDGNRVVKTVGGVTTAYLVDTNNPTGYAQVIDELQDGQLSRTYTYGLDLISQTQPINGAWTTSYYGYDGHGSVRFLTDANSNVTDTYDYDAFGNLINQTGSTPNNYLYSGEQFDPDLGLYYNRARYLDVRTGRFWGMDRYEGDAFAPVSIHKYLYAESNPPNLTDPSGRTPLTNFLWWLAIKGVYVTARIFGAEAHRLIQADIKEKYPNAITEKTIPGGRIDVIIPPDQLYEIKPFGGTVDPERQIDRYIATAKYSEEGLELERGKIPLQGVVDNPNYLSQILYTTPSLGVIEYTAFPSTKAVIAVGVTMVSINLAMLFADLASRVAVAGATRGLY